MGRSNMSNRKRTGAKNVLSAFAKGLGIGTLVVLAVIAVGVLINSLVVKEKTVSQTGPLIPVVVPKSDEPADASSEIDGKYYGLCKKNSIRSVEDFRKLVRNDPVLAAHFAGFNWDTARIEKQEKDVWTFVSYRKGEVIRRTTRAVRLPKGDGYVTDGTHVVRTYCCNDYVPAPAPAAPVERVDAPPRRTENYDNPPSPSPPLPDPPPPYPPPPDPPPPVPEPGTIVLVGTGAGMLGLFRMLRRKRNRPH